ncbi:uncharacterized protein FIBRA_05926 [Fibroporia radiculosa]|uniref:1-phosphatidylinositol-3-phosphate 5-kinase n=1 Tax=Fibroporia radiculosa TaxID=599839 RepID=J4H3T0_9APHY|nr:uncharacterized protein FIBRA_05926 [Fibroporia radiculosa]CCM03779.1 predicted protein [Fibroporia radiculosa]
MESPKATTSSVAHSSELSSRSRSSTKVVDDVTSLTSFNPFSEEDEHDQSSYALVTSLLSKVKNTLAAPLSSAVASSSTGNASSHQNGQPTDQRRPSLVHNGSSQSSKSSINRLNVAVSNPAPPLVSLTPVVSEIPSYGVDYERSPSRGGSFYAPDTPDGGIYGTAIPGFPIQDADARSIKTAAGSIRRSASVSKVIRRIRGEGLSRDYWMDDELCKECYDCKSVFTAWRRKHHCRICGQIFCSRCASNIIKGARFGHDGMVRVCNLCLDKLAKGDDDDDDDRRSINSNMTSPFAAHQLGSDSFSFALGHHPQSPFAASQLFGRMDEPFNLFSIAETRKYGSIESVSGFEPFTPTDDAKAWIRDNPAPFRRTFTDEDKDPLSLSDKFSNENSPSGPGVQTPIDFPVTVPISVDVSMSSVQFPMSSPDQAYPFESPGMLRSRFNSYADFDIATPFIRSRVQSRLNESFGTGEPGWRTRRESTAYAQELNLISMFHLRIMLRQMLSAEQIPNIGEWEETLLKLSLRIARELTFTAHPQRQGADMDVRRYVKIKKIPGGAPKDSEYVDGAVITKNVAHKQMLRIQRNPRVMLVTFPLEFHRVEGQYMHFGQILRQEKDYLGNLATRIAALRPHVVLAEKSVSRLALDALAKHKIAVARTVKPSAIQFVARITQGDVFSSMDKLALEPRLGHCTRFRIQTFDHPLIPGRRKTYMRFEGCNAEMGCTIVLRGGDIETLRRIKKVTRFLAFIVRNLRLETHLWKDSVITLPALTAEATPSTHSSSPAAFMSGPSGSTPPSINFLSLQRSVSQPLDDIEETTPNGIPNDTNVEDLPNEDAEHIRLSRRIQESLEPYEKTFISVSATLRFPPPHPVRRMKELDDQLIRVKREWEDEVIRQEERSSPQHQQEETVTQATMGPLASADPDDIAAQIESLPIPDLPHTPVQDETPPSADRPGYFDLAPMGSSFVSHSPVPYTPAEELPVQMKTVEDIKLESRVSYVQWQHAEQRRIWEWYLRKNKDDFDVEKYQCISLWEATLPMTEPGLHRACLPPASKYMTFYGENDCTLGQFIEKAVMDTLVKFLDPKAICENKSCNEPLARHCKVYTHNESRLIVAVEQWDGQIISKAGYYPYAPDAIITWSVCRTCGSATPFIPVSPEMQRYSFAKFLELHFYPADVQLVQGAGCQHNIYQSHIRYFAIKGMTVRFQAEPIVLHEVVYPPMRIRVRPETQLEIRNNDFERLHMRNEQWYAALVGDLKLINIDAAIGDEEADGRLTAQINHLIMKAEWEKQDIAKLINKIYQDTPSTDTLALNQVRAYRQDKIVAWQQDFDRLPKPRMTQFLDRNSRKPSAFNSMRAMFPRRSEYYSTLEVQQNASETEDNTSGPITMTMRRVTGDSFTSRSSASDASETESLAEKSESTDIIPPAGSVQPQKGDVLVPVEAIEISPKSDPESDSTIGAGRRNSLAVEVPTSPHKVGDDSEQGQVEQVAQPISRLPRRSLNYPSVAELVKKYQDFLPAQGVEELTKTAFPPAVPVSEGEHDAPSEIPPRTRTKGRRQFVNRKSSVSDFESGYAANIAPRYLTHRRPLGATPYSSRIPGPIASSVDSRAPSRRTSPDKRSSMTQLGTDSSSKAVMSSPPLTRSNSVIVGNRKKGKGTARGLPAEKAPSTRPTSSSGPKSTLRRQTGPNGKVSNITKHFERISKDNERANRRYAVIRGRRPRPVASARARVEVLESIKDAIMDESESSDSSEADDEGDDDDEIVKKTKQERTESPKPSQAPHEVDQKNKPSEVVSPVAVPPAENTGFNQEQPVTAVLRATPEPSPSLHQSPIVTAMANETAPLALPPELDMGPAGTERHSILKALSGFWPQAPQLRPRTEQDADDPMADPEHIFRNSSMVVRTDEPTSIIALALNSPQYRDMLAQSRFEKRQAREPKITDGGEAFMPDDRSIAESTSTWGVVNVDSSDGADPTEDLRVPSSKLPWAIYFESGGLTISCTVLYPEQFDALRRTYDCERSMIESLARCVKWDASGGKSGSAFLKTLDDRFIAKELSRAELQAMETFAPAYFDYMSSAVTANRPTLLAKIFGCFKITSKKTHKHQGSSRSKPMQMNLLVMENLFYDRRFSKIYDLKGSTRNRHVQSTGRENEVLLDENLVETAHLAPFYLREHSKRILRGALFNDSKFLADINVMDYSLVVGVDSMKNELVVGIVDYIRTYTWDKKLESWVKDTTFLGGPNRGEPTIIGPKQYRQRFLSAMERYLPLVPDRWMKQRDAPEDEGNSLSDLWPDW